MSDQQNPIKSSANTSPDETKFIQRPNMTTEEKLLFSNKMKALADVYEAKARLARINADIAKGGIVIPEW